MDGNSVLCRFVHVQYLLKLRLPGVTVPLAPSELPLTHVNTLRPR